jgi:hypothetical protein
LLSGCRRDEPVADDMKLVELAALRRPNLGGACAYDESARYDACSHGVLGSLKEMRAAVPRDLCLVHHFEVGLMDQRSRHARRAPYTVGFTFAFIRNRLFGS